MLRLARVVTLTALALPAAACQMPTAMDPRHVAVGSWGGDHIRLEMEATEKRLSPGGRRGFATFAWTCADDTGRVVLTARATFAFRRGDT